MQSHRDAGGNRDVNKVPHSTVSMLFEERGVVKRETRAGVRTPRLRPLTMEAIKYRI